MSKQKFLPHLSPFVAVLVFTGCNSDSHTTIGSETDLPSTSIVVDSSLYEIVITPNSLTYIPMIDLPNQTNYQAIGKYSDGTELDITTMVNWLMVSSDIADIESGHILAKSEGSARVVANLDGISSDEAGLIITSSAVCGHNMNLPLGDASITPESGINDVNTNAASRCIKIASATIKGKTLLFTSSPSLEVLQSLKYKQTTGIDSSNNGRTYAGTVQDGAYGEAFGLFDQRSITGGHGIDGQYDRWCTDLSQMNFAGKNDWRTATIAEMGSNDASRNPTLEGLFQDKSDMATLGWPTEKLYWTNTESNTGSYYDTLLLSDGATFSGGPNYASYASCVSEQF